MNFAVAGHQRVAMAFHHFEAILGADIHAITAGDAAQTVNGPFLLRAIHQYGVGGTFLRTDVAIDTIVLGENQLAARAGDGVARFKWIAGGGRLCQRPFHGQFGHPEVTHIIFLCN